MHVRPALARMDAEIRSISRRTASLYQEAALQVRPAIARVGKEVGSLSRRLVSLYHGARLQARPALARVGKEVSSLSRRTVSLYQEARLKATPALARAGKEVGSLSRRTVSLYQEAALQVRPALARVGKEVGNLSRRTVGLYQEARLRGRLLVARLGPETRNLSGRATVLYQAALLWGRPALARVGKKVSNLSRRAIGLYREARLRGRPALTRVGVHISRLSNRANALKRETALPQTPGHAPPVEKTGTLPGRADRLDQEPGARGTFERTLATLRIYERSTYFVRDTSFTNVDTAVDLPRMRGLTFKVLTRKTELDELIDDGYDIILNPGNMRRVLGKGAAVFAIFADGELASMGWAAMTAEAKAAFRVYPYNVDLDKQACIVGDWTNPRFRNRGLCIYIECKRRQLLRENGFTSERSLVGESRLKEALSVTIPDPSMVAYKRRTCTKAALPGITGGELWQETPLNGTATKPAYRRFTLLFLALPSPPVSSSLASPR
jgi:hypothetical protein